MLNWELAHVSYAVDSIEAWMPKLERELGGRPTRSLSVDAEWRTSLEGGGTTRIQGSVRWLIGPSVPIELWEGPSGSPWHVPPGTMRFDHVCYWGVDMAKQAQALKMLGFELEFTPRVTSEEPATDGPFRGFAYFSNSSGSRVELQRASDKPAMRRWMTGDDLVLDYLEQLKKD